MARPVSPPRSDDGRTIDAVQVIVGAPHLEDIARALGVSRPTISRIRAGERRLSERHRQALFDMVRAAVETR